MYAIGWLWCMFWKKQNEKKNVWFIYVCSSVHTFVRRTSDGLSSRKCGLLLFMYQWDISVSLTFLELFFFWHKCRTLRTERWRLLFSMELMLLAFAFVFAIHMYACKTRVGDTVYFVLLDKQKPDDDKFGMIPALQRKSPPINHENHVFSRVF